ncbi:unnamed protein product [Allacma fusca]|uniref:VWFA domain-containing protein n=1 Tax=Allacma fusca TaxID=39272 RepID=A0A8J2K9U1_9HEXA|nr:unnamed protein product [Allacma fusca]
MLQELAPGVPLAELEKLNTIAYAILWSSDPDFRQVETNPWSISLPYFPLDSLLGGAKLLEKNVDLYSSLVRMYPYRLILNKKEGGEIKAMEDILTKSGFSLKRSAPQRSLQSSVTSSYVPVPSMETVVGEMSESHTVNRDICVIGPKGSGKSTVVRRFAELVGGNVEPIVLFKDMTARELVQQRTTNTEGDTIWTNSPLVDAAIHGKLAVLDGIDQVHSSTLSVIFRLVHDREMQLFNGTRLLRADRYDALKEISEDMTGLMRIHPEFYVVATASVPEGKNKWLTPELLNLFFYHELPRISQEEEIAITSSFCKNVPPVMEKIIAAARHLRESDESSKKSLAASLSTRQIIRIAKRLEKFGGSPFQEVSRACLSRFLPHLNREELESVLKKYGIKQEKFEDPKSASVKAEGGIVRIGNTSAPIWPDSEFKSKVPHVLFYDIQQHILALEQLLRDYILGDHLLLVGNQGVGKNKLVDQLLYLLNRPREYIQLHRDTTVQALTVQQKVVDGVVSFEDSPLVRAAREGHVIVIDEADKAPTHVTCILKTLAESGEMVLSDGRRIVPQGYVSGANTEENKLIKLHPEFRMFVLANRPGFPFLGNDFYSVLGDLFSVHAIDNPSYESEFDLLKRYAPSIDEDYLRRIAKAFGDLRKLADEGTISYPYSTREAVNIVKHIQKYPDDTLAEAVDNVFDFDVYNSELRQTVKNTLLKYKLEPSQGILLRNRKGGLSVNVTSLSDLLKTQDGKPALQDSNKKFKSDEFTDPKFGKVDATGAPHVGGNTWAGGSGGRGTAGLGGAGGPHRLDSGNPVFQVSDEVKQNVPPEVLKMAREMAKKAYEEKLKEIKMSKYDGQIYEEYLAPIRPQIQALRVILQSLQAKAKERKWVKHQTSGELDDSKIIEGIVGEKNVYKNRQDEEPEPGDPQQKPKRLKLIVDVSGSMYRFNGYDNRLTRMLECALLVMESFNSFEDTIQYEIIGHSGEDYKVDLTKFKEPPKNEKERIDVLRMMHLHSQFCASGDNTLEATHDAITTFADEMENCDEAFVIVLSDANLERYGINPLEFAKILNLNSDVKSFAVFIGSLGDQANRLTEKMPPGKAFVCLETAKLPQILQRIFAESVLT